MISLKYLKKMQLKWLGIFLLILMIINLACSPRTINRNNIEKISTTPSDSPQKNNSSQGKTPSSSLFKPLNKNKKISTEWEKFIMQGDELFLKGDFDSAIIKYKTAINKDTSCVDAYIRLGDIYLRKGEYNKSGESFKKAMEIEPENKFARFGYADILLETGEKEKSEKELKKVISIYPKFAQAYTSLGDIYLDRGERKKAEEMFKKSLEIMPGQDFPDTYIGMGELYLSGMKYEEALNSFNMAKKKDPYDIDGYLGAARALTGLKRYDDAQKNYEKAIEIFPDHGEALEMLMEFYRDRGMTDKVKEMKDKFPGIDLQP